MDEAPKPYNAREGMQGIITLLERSVKTKETRVLMSRLMRQTAQLRSHMTAADLDNFISTYLPDDSTSAPYLAGYIKQVCGPPGRACMRRTTGCRGGGGRGHKGILGFERKTSRSLQCWGRPPLAMQLDCLHSAGFHHVGMLCWGAVQCAGITCFSTVKSTLMALQMHPSTLTSTHAVLCFAAGCPGCGCHGGGQRHAG